MPRDLSSMANEKTLQEMAEITQSPAQMTEYETRNDNQIRPVIDAALEPTGLEAELALRANQSSSKRDKLHPYTQTLTASDIPSCQLVEDEAFPPVERCTDAKVSCQEDLPIGTPMPVPEQRLTRDIAIVTCIL